MATLWPDALELPDSGQPQAFHCFTGGKDAIVATRIASTLADQGIAVLRFDFTGLGGSEYWQHLP